MLTAQILHDKYQDDVFEIIKLINDRTALTAAFIVTKMITDTVPSMMTDVGTLQGLKGKEKKQLIVDSIKLIIETIFNELNKYTNLKDESWDEMLEQMILTLSNPTIDLLISVEQNQLKFNTPKSILSKCFPCCK